MPKKYYYPFDLNIDKIWENISDFWKDFADKELLEQFWKGYKILFDDHIGKFSYFTNFAQSLEYVDASPEMDWFIFYFTKDSDICDISNTIYDILTLQDRYEDPTLILAKTTDFTIEIEGDRKYLKLVGGAVSEDTIYWAPKVEFDLREIIWKFIGCLFPLLDYKMYAPDQYKLILQSIWWFSFKGPSLENLAKVVAALCEVTQTVYAGIVHSIVTEGSNKRITIRTENLGDYDYLVPAAKAAVSEGDSVTRFQPLQTGITVEDFKTDPTWWSGMDINDIQARNIVYVEIDSYLGIPKVAWNKTYEILSFLIPKRTKLQLNVSLPTDALIVWDQNQTNRAFSYPL